MADIDSSNRTVIGGKSRRGTNPNSLANLAKGRKNGGRKPQPPEFRELVRTNAIPALRVALSIMQDPDAKPRDRLTAVQIVLDRAYGKPDQPITGADGAPIGVVVLPAADLGK